MARRSKGQRAKLERDFARFASDVERLTSDVLSAAGSAFASAVQSPAPPPAINPLDVLVGRIDAGLELAERVSNLGPIGLGVLAYNSLSEETRERLLGQACADCGEPPSVCECCAECGYSPCACAHRFSLDVEGVSID